MALVSGDGALQFVVEAYGGQAFVRRIQRRPLGTQLALSMNFADPEGFASWCATEPARFDQPLLFDRLRREVDGVFGRRD